MKLSPRFVSPVLLCLAVAAAPAAAHVVLDAPNGGEVLEPGSTYAITWHDSVYHGDCVYDLWYSTTGDSGPWIEIIEDRDYGGRLDTYIYNWTVPNASSNTVRIRVRQDNLEDDYEDISDGNLAINGAVTGTTVTIGAEEDATLYEGDGSLANGDGSYLFTGATESQNGSAERRALVAFDIESAIPAGARVTAVSLELMVSRTISGDHPVELRRVLESWNEGPSDPSGQEGGGAAAQDGDVTWVHRAYPNNMWSEAGGTFAVSASASEQVGGTGAVTFASTAAMVADVQSWLDSPVDNHGWALVMPSAATGSAKRFNSREHETSETRPRLTVSYEGGTMPVVSRVFIPGAARAAGAGGSFFVTTADIHNAGASTAVVQLEWLPRNRDNSNPSLSSEFTLGPGETMRFDDLLSDVFGLNEGVGAAVVLSESNEIEVMTRTYNLGDEGTFGQSLPGVGEAELTQPGHRALVLFLTEDDQLRSNLGLLNGTDRQITVQWELFASNGSSLETGSTNLPPWGNKQFNRVFEDFAPIEAAYAHVWTTTQGGAFTCYGSVLDNSSSDPTTVLPR